MNTKLSNKLPEKILIVKPSSLGDIFHTFPAVSLLAKAYPDCKFHWLVAPQFENVIQYCPPVSKTIIFPRRKLGSPKTFISAFINIIRQLRQEKYSNVIDFQGLLRSAFFAKFAPAQFHTGFASPREPLAKLFYNQPISIPDNLPHAVDRNLHLAEQVCGLNKTFDQLDPLPSLCTVASQTEKLMNNAGLNKNDQCIAIALGARWKSKRWPDKFFCNLISELIKNLTNCKFILLGDKDSLKSANNIVAAVNSKQIISLVDKTDIPQLIEVIHRCKMIICNDSGPMHIAAAAKKPVFAFFGPTIPEKTGPYGRNHHIFQKKLDCNGCLKRYCPRGDMACHNLDINQIVQTIINYFTSPLP